MISTPNHKVPMNKTKIIFIASVIFIIVFFYIYYCFCLYCPGVQENGNPQNKTSDISKACFNERCFDVEIADTPEARAQGLMNRESLDQNSGMLFIFETTASNSPFAKGEKYSFWMKNTLISLDIIWIDENKKVVFIKHNAKPCQADPCETFKPSENTKYVLEINSGLAKKIGIEEGNLLEFK